MRYSATFQENRGSTFFSGSGTIAIEAVSRGAARVQLCEKDKIKVKQVLENVAVTERICNVKIGCHFLAVELFLKRCRDTFDYIFLDPPFPYKFRTELLKTISERRLLNPENPDAMVMIHFPEEDTPPDEIGSLFVCDKRVYGRSIVHFYKMKGIQTETAEK